MKAILVSAVLVCASVMQTFACSTCFGNYADVGGPPPANVQHLAIAIWALMFVVMSVLGGVLVFSYMMLPASTRIYRHNPEHLANRVEVAGLFWHFVDLVWIFVFPLFYLL